MIIYFADRNLNILGQASTELPDGLTVYEDLKTEDIDSGVASFECKVAWNKNTRSTVESYTDVGNYILRHNGKEKELYTIINSEPDTKNQDVYIYAEDAGLDLLNEVVGAYTADAAYSIDHYINKFTAGSGFEIGINEAANLTRKLSWDGEATVTERLASVATQFDGCEISYTFDIDGLDVVKMYINIHLERGKDVGHQLRLNYDIDRIITTKSIANLATALEVTGGTPDDSETPITLSGYSYDDGDFYVSGTRLYSREALKRWGRFGSTGLAGHIVKTYSYDTTSQETLCKHAVTELKKVCEIEVNYEVNIKKLPDDVAIGDRINIVDDAGGLYVSARILKLETSVADNIQTATLGEYLIKSAGISQKVADLAAEFAKQTVSVARAKAIANAAKETAEAAQTTADAAAAEATEAQNVANAAQAAADTAQESADAATTAANNAQSAVETVEKDVESLETTVDTAQAAAEAAQKAAETADIKATEAQEAAVKAQESADTAAEKAEAAQTTADSAVTKAEDAQSTADTAKTDATAAQTTANAAKLDAAAAQADIDSLGESLTTLSNTMYADYARKTDLTEATASLQTQITQNAAEISSTATKVQTIDETANNAQELAQSAQEKADAAQATADQAAADAAATQAAADEAAAAAAAAQAAADEAQAAADEAQSVADKADADLAAAKADLATVSSRVDATEEDIAAAQAAVDTAQAAADKAKADATTAAEKAAAAQSTADTAVTNAANAQATANDAVSKAETAQATADAAQGDATAAQKTADEAAAAAAAAQSTADTAKANATNAQATADQAAADAAAAQNAADEADAKAAQAATNLATAKQNLADVTSRVDATEEEVEAAQAAVEAAQSAADKAQEEAAAAQSTADTAKANAATAQTAADKAKTAADAAQKAADEAQAAADAAQADVDALAVRVTTAETKITQNSEKIELAATKTEVTETLGGYYTKEEADAAIQVKADAITSSVSNTYATKSALASTDTKASNAATAAANAQSTADTAKTNAATAQSTAEAAQSDVDALEKTVETNYATKSEVTQTAKSITSSVSATYATKTETANAINAIDIGGTNLIVLATMRDGYRMQADGADYSSTYSSISADIPIRTGGNLTYTVYGVHTDEGDTYWQLAFFEEDGTFISLDLMQVATTVEEKTSWTIAIPSNAAFARVAFPTSMKGSAKLEYGDKSTDYTPSPDDVATDIDEAQTTADSNATRITTVESTIQQLADCISMLVTDGNGASLMTQTENGWTFSMGELQSAVDDVSNAIDTLEKETGDTSATVSILQQAVADLQESAEYIRVTTYEDEPCLELGESDTVFKLLITNTRIMFFDGSDVPTYISNKGLVTQNIEVKNELIQGGFVWKVRSNGNLGLIWNGG